MSKPSPQRAAPAKPRAPKPDPKQVERFRAFAREHGADADVEEFDRGFRKIVKPKGDKS
jgi:hypothetical protein